VSAGGVAILDLFRPPQGFRTEAALVSTYSADLVSCLAVLIAMDGTAADTARYGRIEALRALQRLRGRVLFVAQQGRLAWNEAGDTRVLSLFDRMTRVVPPPGPRRAFHPKLVIARQVADHGAERFVLSISSRNLTPQSDWDMGIGLVTEGGSNAGTRQLPGLSQFVTGICEAAGSPDHAEKIGGAGLDSARFRLPPGIEDVELGFTTPTMARSFKATLLASIPRGERALLVSPFLSAEMVRNAIQHLGGDQADVLLVSGRPALDKVARTPVRPLLREGKPGEAASALPLELPTAEDDPESTPESDDPEEQEDRGLHAKVFGSATGKSAVVVLGSANLTTPAWLGGNWEAFVRISGDRKALFDPLWEWAESTAAIYRVPPVSEIPTAREDALEELRDALAACAISLHDGPEFSTVTAPAVGEAASRSSCKIDVARLTRPRAWMTWAPAADGVKLPPCVLRERTRFLLFRLRGSEGTRTFVHPAEVTPAIEEDRDRHVFVDVLGVDDFLAYFQSLLTGEIPAAAGDPTDVGGSKEARGGAENAPPLFHLEDLLRRLVEEPRSISELEATVSTYAELMRRAATTDVQRARLADFTACWNAVRAGMELP
jgi:hypothetical protein